MRRRLTVAMSLMVAGALLFTGLFTLLLTVRDSRIQTRNELRNQANGLATSVRGDAADVRPGVSPGLRLRQLLTVLRQPLKLDGEAVLVVTAEGEFLDPTHPNATPVLPNGLTASQISPDALLAGQTITGTRGGVVYAAVPFIAPVVYKRAGSPTFSGPATGVVILTRRPPTGLGAAGPWFLVSSGVIIVIALVVANRLGHRVVRPIEAAEAVTGRIAAGDLAARVPEPPGADPELAALTRAINTMAAGLAQARGAERHFLLSVSHELRTPLTSIRGFAEAIADGAVEDPRNAGEIIALESRRLERLVGDLLDLAKLDARQFSFDMVAVDLAEAVANAADGFAPAAADVGLRLSVSAEVGVGDLTAGSAPADGATWPARADGATWPAPPPPPGGALVVADPDRLAQVVANLLENAIRFAAHEVRVGVQSAPGAPAFWVADDGPGIPAGELPRVFERLYTAGRRPDRPLGSGLGLAIVAELVAAMGGSVHAESPVVDGHGTRFVVTLRPPPGPVAARARSASGA